MSRKTECPSRGGSLCEQLERVCIRYGSPESRQLTMRSFSALTGSRQRNITVTISITKMCNCLNLVFGNLVGIRLGLFRLWLG